MLKKGEIDYLESVISELSVNLVEKRVLGKICFDAVYNVFEKKNSFTIIGSGDFNNYQGIRLAGIFSIELVFDSTPTGFPVLILHEDIPQEANRHFYTHKKGVLISCVCGYIEEIRFMQKFNIQEYIETLVVPFLYGQLYYQKYSRWPWKEYSHNSMGILESYLCSNGKEYIESVILKLKAFEEEWEIVKQILIAKSAPKGHIWCLCEKKDQIRRCHPELLSALRLLYNDIHILKISVIQNNKS